MRGAGVLVIGGGFAGVAAASRLHARGARVTLLDDRTALGGRARSDALEGWTIDVGAQLIATSYARTLALLRGDVGANALRRMPGRDLFLRGNDAYPINFGSVRSLLGFGAIGAADKVRLGVHLLPLLARHRAALRVDGGEVPAVLDRESAAASRRRHVVTEAADALVEPITATFCGARGDDVSLAFYLTLGHYGSEGDMLAPRAGWSALLEAATRGIEVERETRVESLDHATGLVRARAADGRVWDGDAAVIATDAHTAATLLDGGADGALLGWLRTLRYRPSLTVAAAVGAELPHEAFGLLVHNDGRHPVSALAVHGAKQESGGTGDLVLAWPTPDAADHLIDRTPREIAEAIVPAIETLLPAAAGRIGRVRVYRHPLGTPLPTPGFAADRAAGRELAGSTLPPTLALAGDYLTMPLLEGAVASGEAAADRIAAALD
ncbi:MAG TPA: FAD-dependent oxidoreductase [Gemmatimonadaceae bacterium]|nr:FAD-dependent oxidoreductase [Gemmatimonadaceae bacterium]